jgi:hypothetical protein
MLFSEVLPEDLHKFGLIPDVHAEPLGSGERLLGLEVLDHASSRRWMSPA